MRLELDGAALDLVDVALGALDAADQLLRVGAVGLGHVEGVGDLAADFAVDVLEGVADVVEATVAERAFEGLVGAVDRVIGRVQDRLDDEEELAATGT